MIGLHITVDPASGRFDEDSVVIVSGDSISIVDFDWRPPRSVLAEPITSNRNPADLEALRAAQLRRERKVTRQAKGFR